MDLKKLLLISLIAIAVLASMSVISAGLFDGLLGGVQQDTVVEIEGITFNTTNATDFQEDVDFEKEFTNEYTKCKGYSSVDENGKYIVAIIDYTDSMGLDDDMDEMMGDTMREEYANQPYQTINGVVVYTTSKVSGDDVGKPFHASHVQNTDRHQFIVFGSTDPNETAKMVTTLKFK